MKDSDKESRDASEDVPCCCSQRWILAYVGFFGYVCHYSLRANFSMAILCMVRDDNATATELYPNTTEGECEESASSRAISENAEFDWPRSVTSSMLASVYYGYICNQIPGGWLSDRFGGRRVLGIALFTSSICTMILPVGARQSYILVYVLRVIVGLATGIFFPSIQSVWGRSAPPLERSQLLSFTMLGGMTFIWVFFWFFLTSDVPSQHPRITDMERNYIDGSIEYNTNVRLVVTKIYVEVPSSQIKLSFFAYGEVLPGGMTFIWVFFWVFLTSDVPSQHPRITDIERKYIDGNIEYNTHVRTLKVPWLSMAKSRPLWACLVAHVAVNWTDYTLLTSLPTFMKEVYKFDIKSNGVLSAVPYVCQLVSGILAGQAADKIRSKRWLNTTNTRKLLQIIAFCGAGVLMVAAGFTSCEHRNMAVGFSSLAVAFTALSLSGYAVNHVDFAPKYAGVLYGITNTVATIPGIVAPIVAGALTPNKSQSEWRNVFYVCAGFDLLGVIVFGLFASGELEDWAKDEVEVTYQVKVEGNKEIQYDSKLKKNNEDESIQMKKV